MNLSLEEINKMKVAELRAELTARGLDTKGVKAILVDRLAASITSSAPSEDLGNGSAPAAEPTTTTPEVEQTGSPRRSRRSGSEQKDGSVSPTKSPVKASFAFASPIKETPPPQAEPETKPVEQNGSPVKEPESAKVADAESKDKETVDVDDKATKVSEEPMEVDKTNKTVEEEPASVVNEEKTEEENKTKDVEMSESTKEDTEKVEVGEKRKLDDTSEEKEAKRPKKEESRVAPQPVPENEPEYDSSCMLLDWYKSDLNFKISTDNYLDGEPLVFDDFPFAFAGAKANHGFKGGKLMFEVKWAGSCEISTDFGEHETKHILRVGWSDANTDLQLGEEKFSYGYDSRGKFFNGGECADAPETVAEGDVIAAYIDLESDSKEIKYTKNGTLVGEPIKLENDDLEGKVWFPHILVRNVKVEANFGVDKEPANEPLEGFQFIGKYENTENKVQGSQRPSSREECELVMVVGLAGSGKTKWSKDYAKENRDKNYNILGTSTVVERALKDRSVLSDPKAPKVYESFLMKAGKFVERLVDIAPSRRRNYILDQSNALPSVQRRKCDRFQGFRRRAVIILPSDEEYQKRIKAKEQEQGKSVPKSTILDMKASFRLPEVGDLFSAVDFPELPKAEAEKLISRYNREGWNAGYGRAPGARGGPRGGRGFRGFRGMPPRGGMRGRGGFDMGPRGFGGMRPPMNRGRGRGDFMGGLRGPPPMRIPRGPPVQGGGYRGMNPRYRGGDGPRGGGPPFSRGGRGGGSGGGVWSRGSPNGMSRPSNSGDRGSRGGGFSNNSRGSPGRGGNGSRGMNRNSGTSPSFRSQTQQNQSSGWNTQVWSTAPRSAGFSQQSQMQQQQYPDPWQVQQVPDQGYGQSWDTGNRNSNASSGGGTWQGYGGQTYNNFSGGYGRK